MSDVDKPRIFNGLGGPPRLRPIQDHEITPRHREAIRESMRFMDGADDEKDSKPLHPFPATMCRHVELFDRYMAFGMNILKNALIAPREREILTLRTGWLCDAPFEWGAHVKLGREAGLADEEIERIKIGPEAAGWSAVDRALLSAVDEMHYDATIDDATWEVLATHYSDEQLIELPMIVGQYHMTAFFQNALRFRPVNDASGKELAREETVT